MIYLFWPGRAIPDWLLHVEAMVPPVVEHRGYGFVVGFRGRLRAFLLHGTFAYIKGNGGPVTVTGGGKSLSIMSSVRFNTTAFYLANGDSGARIGTHNKP